MTTPDGRISAEGTQTFAITSTDCLKYYCQALKKIANPLVCGKGREDTAWASFLISDPASRPAEPVSYKVVLQSIDTVSSLCLPTHKWVLGHLEGLDHLYRQAAQSSLSWLRAGEQWNKWEDAFSPSTDPLVFRLGCPTGLRWDKLRRLASAILRHRFDFWDHLMAAPVNVPAPAGPLPLIQVRPSQHR